MQPFDAFGRTRTKEDHMHKREPRLEPYKDSKDLAQQLRKEHQSIDQWFGFVIEEANNGDWYEMWQAWHPFASLVERHMQFEERELFPRLEAESSDGKKIVETLLTQHQELRDRIFSMSIDMELKACSPKSVEAIVESLKSHARHEDETLYPWLAERGGPLR